ncbi:kinase-like domain-containing protein [Massariosphaeria phaeospora]|uniref:non-specific serine/threonine protein kinase n=1 Tax=Massariosphaeria phaeospora TaxID=100035 RepID=A0A7C8M0X9_9PLEO|nr:kinase-like domain-containing protein [Massariosphaeria phaeospora]
MAPSTSSVRNDFVVVKRLTKPEGGDHGACNSGIYLVKLKTTGKKYVEKRLGLRAIRNGFAQTEKDILKKCAHANIVDYKCSDLDPAGLGYASIYTQHYELGALDTLIDRFHDRGRHPIPERFLWKVLADMALALCYLATGVDASQLRFAGRTAHRRSGWTPIVHQDIKPGNVFLTWKCETSQYPALVLGDVGCAVRRSEYAGYRAGAPAFYPPEGFAKFAVERDVYQLGLVVHCLAQLLRVPWEEGGLVREDPLGGTRYSGELGKVAKACLRRRGGERPRAGELPAALWEVAEGRRREGRGVGVELPGWAVG